MESQNKQKIIRENGQIDLQNTTRKPKAWATQTLLDPVVEAVDQEEKTAPVPHRVGKLCKNYLYGLLYYTILCIFSPLHE